jgi:hypothetical protein
MDKWRLMSTLDTMIDVSSLSDCIVDPFTNLLRDQSVGRLMSTRQALGLHLMSDSKSCTYLRIMRRNTRRYSSESTPAILTLGS